MFDISDPENIKAIGAASVEDTSGKFYASIEIYFNDGRPPQGFREPHEFRSHEEAKAWMEKNDVQGMLERSLPRSLSFRFPPNRPTGLECTGHKDGIYCRQPARWHLSFPGTGAPMELLCDTHRERLIAVEPMIAADIQAIQ